jgi:hypothetical protein
LLKELENNEQCHPHFIFDVVDDIDSFKGKITTKKYLGKDKSYTFCYYEMLTTVSRVDSSLEGPYLVLSSVENVSDVAGKIVIAPKHCIIKPIASKTQWLPVASTVERIIIKKMESAQQWYASHVKISIDVQKCLKPMTTEVGQCWPSFLLIHKKSSLALDIQTQKDSNYIIKKSLEYIIMTKLGGVAYCNIDPSLNTQEIGNLCFDFCSKVFKEFTHSIKNNQNAFQGRVHQLNKPKAPTTGTI